MSDLISRSNLIMRLSDYALQESPNDNERTGEQRISKMIYDAIQNCISCVEEQPTAYDIGKIVEELRKIKGLACDGKSCSECEYTSDCLEGEQSEKVAIDKAIEIVKQGCAGTGTKVETIRDKAVKWNNNSSKRVPYEFIDYVEGKRDIGVSDDVCEWTSTQMNNEWKPSCEPNSTYNVFGVAWFRKCPYCGKKIKVVE